MAAAFIAPIEAAPSSTSLSPFALRSSDASSSHVAPITTPRRAPIHLHALVVGAAIGIGCIAAFVGQTLRRADASTPEAAASPVVIVASTAAAVAPPIASSIPSSAPTPPSTATPASVAVTAEPKPQPPPRQAAPGHAPAPIVNAGAVRAPAPPPVQTSAPAVPERKAPKATNRTFDIED